MYRIYFMVYGILKICLIKNKHSRIRYLGYLLVKHTFVSILFCYFNRLVLQFWSFYNFNLCKCNSRAFELHLMEPPSKEGVESKSETEALMLIRAREEAVF